MGYNYTFINSKGINGSYTQSTIIVCAHRDPRGHKMLARHTINLRTKFCSRGTQETTKFISTLVKANKTKKAPDGPTLQKDQCLSFRWLAIAPGFANCLCIDAHMSAIVAVCAYPVYASYPPFSPLPLVSHFCSHCTHHISSISPLRVLPSFLLSSHLQSSLRRLSSFQFLCSRS